MTGGSAMSASGAPTASPQPSASEVFRVTWARDGAVGARGEESGAGYVCGTSEADLSAGDAILVPGRPERGVLRGHLVRDGASRPVVLDGCAVAGSGGARGGE